MADNYLTLNEEKTELHLMGNIKRMGSYNEVRYIFIFYIYIIIKIQCFQVLVEESAVKKS